MKTVEFHCEIQVADDVDVAWIPSTVMLAEKLGAVVLIAIDEQYGGHLPEAHCILEAEDAHPLASLLEARPLHLD